MLILNSFNYWSTISTADDHDQAFMQLFLCKQSKFLKPPYHKNAQRYDYAVNIQINFMLSLSNWPQWVKKFTKLPFPQNECIHKTNNLFASNEKFVSFKVLSYLINYWLLDTWQLYLIPLWHHFCISFHLCAKCNI